MLTSLLVVPVISLAAAAGPKDTTTSELKRPFALSWFSETPQYTRLLALAAKRDSNVPGIKLSKEDVDAALGKVAVSEKEMEWVKKYASPLSPSRQRKRVRTVMDILLSKKRVALGKKFRSEHSKLLAQTAQQYDVEEADLLAMMNAESRFGEVQGTFVVATVFAANMAYLPAAEAAARAAGDYKKPNAVASRKNLKRVKKRVRYAAQNFVTLLRYAKLQKRDPFSFRGSWAGAIGITQFMPASLRYAVDGDGDGVVDLSTVPDAVASTANYLVKHGYRKKSLKARKKAFHAYNPNSEYVRAIVAYADRIGG